MAPGSAQLTLAGHRTMPYVLLTKGIQPRSGWPLFISMHGGGRSSAKQQDPHGNTVCHGVVPRKLQTMMTILLSRGDPCYVFPAKIKVEL